MINHEQIQALLEKAEIDDLALNGNEISNQLRHLADNEIDSDSFAVVTENYNGLEVEFERPITDLAIDAAEVIDALLAERDADKALIVEQAKRIDELREWNAGLAQESLDRQQRIAELVHNHRIHAARLIAELGQLKERIAELEASHTKLRGSMAAIHNTIRLDGAGVSLSALLSASKRAYEESAAAAGITLVVGE